MRKPKVVYIIEEQGDGCVLGGYTFRDTKSAKEFANEDFPSEDVVLYKCIPIETNSRIPRWVKL